MSASSALKGYRTQFLYSLYRILKESENGYTYQPEGFYEDLDILDNENNHIEIIQIKNLSSKLVFSDLFTNTTSFFNRAEKAITNNENCIIKLVSFGDISDEITDKKKLEKKLKNKKFKEISIKKLVDNFFFEIIEEKDIEEKVLELIKDTNLFSDPKISLELLIYWLYTLGENRKPTRTSELILNLQKIGKFISEQEAFNKSFNNTILPLKIKNIENDDLAKYKDDFYYGVSARYEHILADLDIIREEKLSQIETLFQESNIVFIHGASGQGKSTLAYRYLNNYGTENIVYELKISESLNSVFDTINSLDALSKGLNFPILLYIDVTPQNTNWNEILKELYGKENIKFLVTIRQEDWNFRSNDLQQYYKYKEIELNFNKEEAKIIYDSLSKYKKDLKFTDFEESWNAFGNQGLLLEYVYLINQGNTLKSRLFQQVQNIRNKVSQQKTDELDILKYVCLSDSFNAKLSYKKLINHLNIKVPIKYINELEKEYLLQYSENKEYLLGLHPIRSKILCEILFDEDEYTDIYEFISNALSLIDEDSIHEFLLNSFMKGYYVNESIKSLIKINFKTYTAYKNVFNALMWKGVYDFIFEKNFENFEELRNFLGDAWSLGLPFNFTSSDGGSMHDIIKNLFPDDKNEVIKQIHKGFSDESLVFEYILEWFEKISISDLNINNDLELDALSEILFWKAYLNHKISIEFNLTDVTNLSKKLKGNQKEFAKFIYSIGTLPESERSFTSEIKNNLIEYIRKEYSIPYFQETNDTITAQYFYNPIKYEEENLEFKENLFHEMTMEIVDLLRYIFPNKKKYNVKGIALTNFLGINFPYDPSEKNISNENLPIEYLVNINSLFLGVYRVSYKNSMWTEYTRLLNERRNLYNSLTYELVKSFSEYFRTNNYTIFADTVDLIESKIYNLNEISLPASNEYNKWGYRESVNKTSFEDRYSLYKKYQKDYFQGIENFLRQIGGNILAIYKDISGVSEKEYNHNIAFYNIKEAIKNHVWFKEEYNKFFRKYNEPSFLKNLEESESNNLQALFYCWNKFYSRQNGGNRVFKDSQKLIENERINLTKRFKAERERIFKETGFSFDIELNTKLEKKLIITNEVFGNTYLHSLIAARELVRKVLRTGSLFSAKRLFIEINIESVIYIPTIFGNPINSKAFEINLNHLDEEIVAEDFYKYINFFNNIPKCVLDYYQFELWNTRIDSLKHFELNMGNISTLLFFQIQKTHLNQIKISEEDKVGKEIVSNYFSEIKTFMKNKISDELQPWKNIENDISSKELYNKTKSLLNNYLLNIEPLNEDLELLQRELGNQYYIFADELISKNFNNHNP